MPYSHGYAAEGKRTKEWRSWHNMRARCFYECHDRYPRYGGRGITVCAQWRDSKTGFVAFLKDVGCAPSPKHTLGRIDNEGQYEPGNVEWQLPKPQSNNRTTNHWITSGGRTQTLQQWSE